MKHKLLLMMLLIAISSNITSCGVPNGKSNTLKKTKTIAHYTRRVPNLGLGRPPDWIVSEGGITTFGGAKFAWIKGMGLSRSQKMAKRLAQEDVQGNMLEVISLIVTRQFTKTWKALGVGDDQLIEQVKQSLATTKSRVTIGGFRVLRSHREQVAPILSLKPDGQPGRRGKAKWRYYVMMGMAYQKYKNLRNLVAKKVSRKASNDQKELIQKACKELKRLDKIDQVRDVAIPTKKPETTKCLTSKLKTNH